MTLKLHEVWSQGHTSVIGLLVKFIHMCLNCKNIGLHISREYLSEIGSAWSVMGTMSPFTVLHLNCLEKGHPSIQHFGSWQAKIKEIVKNEEEWSEIFIVYVRGEGRHADRCWEKSRKLLLETKEDEIKMKSRCWSYKEEGNSFKSLEEKRAENVWT